MAKGNPNTDAYNRAFEANPELANTPRFAQALGSRMMANQRQDSYNRAFEANPELAQTPEFTQALGARLRQASYNKAFEANPGLAQSPEFTTALATNPGFMSYMASQAPAPQASGWDTPEFEAALAANPEFQALFEPQYSAAGNSGLYDNPDFVLGDTAYTQEDLLGMTNEEAYNLFNTHGNFFHENKNNHDIHSTVTMQQGRAMATPAFVQKLTDYAEETRGGVRQFLSAVQGLQWHNPNAFEEWERANPEMALRYHARAAVPNGGVGGIEGYDHSGRAQSLAYYLSQEAGFGEDGKQDGRSIAYDFRQFNDVNSENGDGDFWKLGTAQTFTNDLSDFIEDNPWQVAGMVASIAVPWAAPMVAGALGVSNAVASGIMGAGLQAVQGGDLQDILLAGVTAYGGADLPASKVAEIQDSIINMAPELGDTIKKGWEIAEGVGTATDIASDLGDIANEYNDWENNDDLEGVPDLPWVQGEHLEGNVTPPTPEDNSGGGGGDAGGGGGAPSAPQTPEAPSDNGGSIPELGDRVNDNEFYRIVDGVVYTPKVIDNPNYDYNNPDTYDQPTHITDGWEISENHGEHVTGLPDGSYDDGGGSLEEGDNPEPPTPQEDLPQGYQWVLVDGVWDLQSTSDSDSDLGGIGVGSGGSGSGSGDSGSGSGGSGGSGGGSGGGTGTGGGSGSGSGTGTGTGSGNGSGDGSGDGDGDGPGEGGTRTPIADGLMGSLTRGPGIPLTKADRSTLIETKPLMWDFLRANK